MTSVGFYPTEGGAQHREDPGAALFAQGLQTRGPLELNLGDRLGAL